MSYFLTRLRRDLFSLGLLTLLLAITSGSLAVADWTPGLILLTSIVLLAMLAGYLLSISRFGEGVMLIFALIYGAVAVWVIIATLLPDELGFQDRVFVLGLRLSRWIEQATEGGFSRDNLIFVLLLGLVFWFLGFNAASNIFRTGHLWLAVIPPGLVLLINNFYYVGEARLDLLLIGYLFLTFTLAVQTNSSFRQQVWRNRRVTFTPGIQFDLLRGGVIAGVLLIAIAWSAPAASASNRLSAAWDQGSNPWHRVQDTFNRLFGGVEGGAAVSADYYGGAYLSMGGPINLGQQEVMYVYAPEGYHYYWRSKIFDTYQNGRWTATTDKRIGSDLGVLNAEDDEIYAGRINIQQRFEIVIPATQLVYAAPQVISFASLPVTYDIAYTGPGTEFGVVTAVRADDILRSGESYTATSSVSVADEASLRLAGTDYPDWVRERYLSYPDDITDRTKALAAQIMSPYDNPYDKARAVESWLRANITYNEQVPLPPRGSEPVDYVLFESKEGYCTYYASAMAIMLRTQGIPARVSAGFLAGQRDPTLNAYRVIEADAHAWVEVFFPGYGWTEFEPTAAESPIVRPAQSSTSGIGGAEVLRDPQSPDGGLLDDPTRLEPDGGLSSEDPFGPQTLPELIQTFRLPAWAQALIVVIVLAVGAGAGVWLWFERRGLGGLSEVSRAYARLNIFAPWIGVRLERSATPFERAERIGAQAVEGRPMVERIADLYVEEQYAPPRDLDAMHRDRANSNAGESWSKLRGIFVRLALVERIKEINPLRRLFQR